MDGQLNHKMKREMKMSEIYLEFEDKEDYKCIIPLSRCIIELSDEEEVLIIRGPKANNNEYEILQEYSICPWDMYEQIRQEILLGKRLITIEKIILK